MQDNLCRHLFLFFMFCEYPAEYRKLNDNTDSHHGNGDNQFVNTQPEEETKQGDMQSEVDGMTTSKTNKMLP